MPENNAVTFEEHKAALTKIAAQELVIQRIEKQLNEATDAFNLLNATKEAVAKAEHDALAEFFEHDSEGKIKKEEFQDWSLDEMYKHQKMIAKAGTKGFVSVARQKEHDSAEKKKPQFTVGWQDEKGEWHT